MIIVPLSLEHLQVGGILCIFTMNGQPHSRKSKPNCIKKVNMLILAAIVTSTLVHYEVI